MSMEIKVTAMHFSWLQIIMTSSIMEEEESKNKSEKERQKEELKGLEAAQGRKKRIHLGICLLGSGTLRSVSLYLGSQFSS